MYIYYSQFILDRQAKTDQTLYNFLMEFTKRFNEVLQQSGKTQVEIAQALNVTKQCVNDYKTGKSVPSIETLYHLCRYLDAPSDYLLGLTDDY